MNYKKRLVGILMSVFLGASILAGCGNSSSTPASGGTPASTNPVTVGLVGPFTGFEAFDGQYMNEAWTMAQSAEGSSPGGHPLNFVRFDSQCTPAAAQAAIRQATGSAAIQVIEGPVCSAPLAATQGLLNAAQIPHLEAAYGTSVTNSGDRYIFRVEVTNNELSKILAKYMKSQGVKKVAILNDTSGYSTNVAETMTSNLATQHITPVAHITFTGGATDFSGDITRLKQAGVTDLVLGCYETDCGHIVKQASDLGLKARIWGVITVESSNFASAVGSGYKNIVDNGKVTFATSFVPTNPAPQVAKFAQAWQKQHGQFPIPDIASFYASAQIIEGALKKISGPVTRASLTDLLRKTQINGTVLGNISFDSKGNLKCPPLFIGDWVNGVTHIVQNDSATCSGLAG